ncbi:MAG TPA: type VI secretion system-associated FHA domain protein TagH [Steroidobacteraceae bacterium]|jgi:type VI secretion system protein
MALKLRVISDHYKALGKQSSRLFGVTGGRIGRAPDNDWVLPDPDRYVSSHHCRVEFRAGKWLLEDTSTNGVFVNGSDTPASVEGIYTLKDGDRLRLGDYEILVSIDDRNDFPPDASGQLPVPPAVRAGKSRAPVEEDLGEELDLTDLLSDSMIAKMPDQAAKRAAAFELALRQTANPQPAKPAPQPSAKAQRGGYASLLAPTLEEAESTVALTRKNDDWQMQTRPYDRKTMEPLPTAAALARPEQPREKPRAERARRPGETSELAAGVEAFCRGAGIDPSNLPSDAQHALLTIAGQMFREVVLGLMDILKGRADLKSRLRLSQTTIQPTDNNPLKFSASVEEAMMKLLDAHGNRYLGPIEAIRDSFADMRAHQAALAAAIQSAVDELMSRIEPGELQERFDRGLKRGALLGAANKMKYWDLYVEFYQVLNQRNEHGLPTLFAEELARTYAERTQKKK